MDLLAQMATFVSVVDGKSLSSAARVQRVSLPAVSRQLRALETELGTSLIVRSTRRISPCNGAGLAYLPDFLVADDLAAGRLKRVLPGWSSPPRQAVAIHRAELRGAPRLGAFLDAMDA